VPVAAVQPAVSIDSVTQGLLLPVSKATYVQYQVRRVGERICS
jgi:hypothetical protein